MGIIFRNSYLPTAPIDEGPAVPTPRPTDSRFELVNVEYSTPRGKTLVSDESARSDLRWYGNASMNSVEPTLTWFAWDAPWITLNRSKGEKQ